MTALEPEDAMSGIDPIEHARLARENAMLRAGVDLDSDQGKILADAWANKEPDVESIRTQWTLLKPQPVVEPEPSSPASPQLSEAELSQATERQDLAAGGHLEPGTVEVDPMEESMHLANQVLHPPEGSRQRAGTSIDAIATGLHVRAEAAHKGDTRVLVQDQ